MIVLWVLIGIVLLAVVFAIISSSSGKVETKEPNFTPPPKPVYEDPVVKLPKAHSWEDGAKASVSSKFGRGGAPSGVSKDSSGLASNKVDEEFERLKKARPFEPRAIPKDYDSSEETVGEPV